MSDHKFESVPDLSQAVVDDRELNPLAYAPDEYPTADDVISFILQNNTKPPVEINLEELSVNGKVVKDEMEIYLGTKAISSSAAKEVLKTPLHYYFYMNQLIPKKDKKAFELGSFAHMAFLEPSIFKKCITEPKASLASKDGCATLIKFYETLNQTEQPKHAECKDWSLPDMKSHLNDLISVCKHQIVSEDHKAIIDALEFHYYRYGGGIIPMILKGAIYETSFYGKDDQTGLDVKIRPDAFNIMENIGVDAVISMKTTAADSIEKFYYDAAKYKYELSEGMYQQVASDITGRKVNTTIMIMLQTQPPYAPAVFIWDAEDLHNGKYKYRSALDTIYECKQKNLYPGYDAKAPEGNYGIIEMKLPDWSLKEIHPVSMDN